MYDYGDEWIDDTELIEYFGGDQRRAKHKGFFINKGDIEREDAPAKTSPPVRKRRRKEDDVDKQGRSSEEPVTEPANPRPVRSKGLYGSGTMVHIAQKKAKKAPTSADAAEPAAADVQPPVEQPPAPRPAGGRENAPPDTPQRASVPPQGAPQPTPKPANVVQGRWTGMLSKDMAYHRGVCAA